MNHKNNESEQAAKLRKKAEELALKKTVSSEKLDALSPEEIRQTLHELQVHQIELEMQNEELRRVQTNLDEAMERYFDLYNLAPVGYFTINEKGLIIETNLMFATLLGVEKNTLIKKPFTRFILPDDQDVFYNHHKQIITTDTDTSQACELRMVKKDGTKFWVHLESTTARDSDGEQVYRVVMNDITERKKADEILSQSEEKFRKKFSTLFDDAPAGIVLVDKNGIIQEVNNNLLQLLSIRKEELIGSSFVVLAPAFGLDITENITDFKNRLTEAPSNKEITFLNKNNNKTTITVQSSVIKSGDEIHGILYILHDITERKKAEEQLKYSEERYKNLIELAPDSIVTMNLKGYITSCNSAATRIFRYSKDDLVGKHFSKIGVLHVKDVPKYLKVFVSLLQRKSSGIYELAVYDKDGTARIAETHIGLIKENNKISGICAITRDITERKRTEENLKNSLEQLTFTQKAAKSGFWDWDMKTGKLTWSKEFFELFGLPSDAQPTFDTWRKVLHPNDRKRAEEKIYRSIEDKISLDNEYRIILSDGKERWIRAQGDTFYDYSGNPQRMGGICIDITRQKQMEDGLKQIERELNKAQQIAHVGSWVWDIKNQTLTWTDELYRIYGVDKDFPLALENIVSMIHPEDREKNAAKVKQLLESATTLEYEFRIIRPDTSIRHIFQSIEVSRDSTGEPLRAVGIIQDITQRKKIEKEIIESEEKLKQILDSSPDAIAVTDLKGNVIECNQTASKMYGSPKTELIGKNALEFLSPKNRKKAQENLMKTLELGSTKNVEYTLLTKDGREYPAELSASLIRDASGNPQSFVSIVRDITERKKAEGALIESQEKYRLITENTNDLIMITNLDKTFRYVSPSIKSLGYTPDELIGQDSFSILHPEDNISITSMLKRLIIERYKPGTSSRFEYRLRDKSGMYHIYETAVKLVKDESGKHVLLSVSRDITERKKAAEELQKSETLLNDVSEMAHVGGWELDIKTKEVYWTKETYRIHDISLDEKFDLAKAVIFFDLPERSKLEAALQHCMDIGEPFDLVLPFTSAKRRHLWTRAIGRAEKNDSGKVVKLIGTFQDITERKKAEEALRESQKRFQALTETTNDFVWETDANGVYTYCSPQMNDLWGYKPEDMIGRTPFDVMIPEDRARVSKMFRSMSKSPKSFQGLESDSWDKSGRIVKLETSGVPFFDIDGRLRGYRGISRDITERKRAEENLRKNEEKFRILFDSSPNLIIETDDDGIILALNQIMAKSLGAPSEKLIGKNIFDILPKEIAEERAKIARIALKDGKNQETDDERAGRYFHNIYAPVLHPDGTKTIQTIVRDITEKKKTEDALLESEEKYRVLFNDVPVGIGITDKNGVATDCNQYLADMFGMTCGEFKGSNVKSLYLNPEDRERFQNRLNKEGRVVDWECFFKRKDGTVFSAILSADVIDRDGQKLNLTTLRDITERKVAEEKIRKQNVQLKKLDSVKTDFLNTTSHELRTPVASIKGYIQMLLKHTLGDITEEQKNALEVVLRNTNRLDALIQDILDISRLESGTMRFIHEKTEVIKMVNEVAETIQTSADVKRIKIISDIQKDLPDLMIDSERVKQVLINLVDNAIKFSPDDSMILIKARKEKEEVVFEVQDFGRGIPKSKQNKIFERFYQVDSGTDRKFGGIGLGLTISKKIIDAYGGHIWVDSIVGKGSSFKFSLPLQSTKDIKDYLQEIPMELP